MSHTWQVRTQTKVSQTLKLNLLISTPYNVNIFSTVFSPWKEVPKTWPEQGFLRQRKQSSELNAHLTITKKIMKMKWVITNWKRNSILRRRWHMSYRISHVSLFGTEHGRNHRSSALIVSLNRWEEKKWLFQSQNYFSGTNVKALLMYFTIICIMNIIIITTISITTMTMMTTVIY